MKPVKLCAAIVAMGASIASATGTHVVREPDRLQPRDGKQLPSTFPVPGKPTAHGCYSSTGNMTKVGVPNMSSGSCTAACTAKKYWVAGLNANQCLCGYAYPEKKSATKDSNCNYPCPYFPQEACGGLSDGDGGSGYISVFNLGINVEVNNYEPPKSSSTNTKSSTTSTATSTSSNTVSTTQSSTEAASTTAASSVTSTADSDKDEKSGGPNVAAIAAGVVAGVVVVAAAIAGGFFYLRRKRNAEIEEEHRRNAAVNAFISGSQPPSTSGSISMTDSRLDPVMAHRRLSDGSIADNQDYSRKILRVTNA